MSQSLDFNNSSTSLFTINSCNLKTCNLFLPGCDEEQQRNTAISGPGEVHALQHPVRAANPVLQGALVEVVGGEGRELGVHAVLDFQARGAKAQLDQALE